MSAQISSELPEILQLNIVLPASSDPKHQPSPIEIQVSPQEIVQEIQTILQTEYNETCHQTCFSLHFNGQKLDTFSEIGSIEGLENGSNLIVVEDPYNLKEAKNHIKHLRQLIRNLDCFDANFGQDMQSFSFTSQLIENFRHEDVLEVLGIEESKENKKSPVLTPKANNSRKKNKRGKTGSKSGLDSSKSVLENLETAMLKNNQMLGQLLPPPFNQLITASETEPNLAHYFPERTKNNGFYIASDFLKHFSISPWNPPTRNRQLVGDIIYVELTTVEGKNLNITCSRKGWYVNNSTADKFDPTSKHQIFHSLISLLSHVSPAFHKALSVMKYRKLTRHVFERLPTSYQYRSWIGKNLENYPVDPVKLDEMFSNRLQQEEHIPGQTRDWNEEFQTTREMSCTTQEERLLRDRSSFKSHSDFVAAATRGAMMVVDGAISPLNPISSQKNQMFLWNHIFFSFAFDCTKHFEKVGADSAAHISPGQDLHGIKLFNDCEIPGLYTIGTVLIDYRGFRVVCQSVIPGILEREHDESVNYGSNDYGKTISWDNYYVDRLSTVKEKLRIDTCQLSAFPSVTNDEKRDPNFQLPDSKMSFNLPTSIETKGILGSDKRHYLIDLQRILPPDINFMAEEHTGGLEPKATLKCNGFFPLAHPHKVPQHRKELVDQFITAKHYHFMNVVYKEIESRKKKAEKAYEQVKIILEEKGESVPPLDKFNLTEKDHEEILEKAAEAVSSLNEKSFDIRFSSDCVSPVVEINEPSDALEKKRLLLRQLSYYLVNRTIPKLITDFATHAKLPLDGHSLVKLMHSKGIPVRYLGYLLLKLEDKEKELENFELLQPIKEVILLEMINRAAKHVYRGYVQTIELSEMAINVSNFLNALIGHVKRDPSKKINKGKTGKAPTLKKLNKNLSSSNESLNSISSTSSREASPERKNFGHNLPLTGYNRLGSGLLRTGSESVKTAKTGLGLKFWPVFRI